MAREKKYYKTKRAAIKARDKHNSQPGFHLTYGVFKMPKGTRHHGEYAVCTEFEWLNTD